MDEPSSPSLAQAPRQGRPLRDLGCSVPVTSIHLHASVFAELGLRPEFVLNQETVLTMDETTITKAKELTHSRRGGTAHAPFMALFGTTDSVVALERYEEVLHATAEWCSRVGLESCVIHTGWDSKVQPDHERWLQDWIPSFIRVTRHFVDCDVRPLIENCHESTPQHLTRVVDQLHPETRCCLDPGHAIVVGTTSIPAWIDSLGSLLHEIHLHDNQGQRDEHLPLGEGGGWDARSVLSDLTDHRAHFVPVIEPLDEATARRSLVALGSWGLYTRLADPSSGNPA